MGYAEALSAVETLGTFVSFPLVSIAILLLLAAVRMLPPKRGRSANSATIEMSPRHRAFVIALLALGAVGYGLDVSDRMGWLLPIYRSLPLARIYDRTFTNETVVVDGKYFINCKFVNVTFRTKGGYYEFENAAFDGTIAMDTPEDKSENVINLFVWLDKHTQNHAFVSNWKKLPPEHFETHE